jgi:hypothetical protein
VKALAADASSGASVTSQPSGAAIALNLPRCDPSQPLSLPRVHRRKASQAEWLAQTESRLASWLLTSPEHEARPMHLSSASSAVLLRSRSLDGSPNSAELSPTLPLVRKNSFESWKARARRLASNTSRSVRNSADHLFSSGTLHGTSAASKAQRATRTAPSNAGAMSRTRMSQGQLSV